MALQLEIVSENKQILGDDYVRLFSQRGGTIGRSLQNDWILPDPDRFISGRHAAVAYRNGVYYLADMSTNGVYVNGERIPVGKGDPRRLFDGDRLRMGKFEFTVSVDDEANIAVPDEDASNSASLAALLDTTGNSVITELPVQQITGDAEFRAMFFDDDDGQRTTNVLAEDNHQSTNVLDDPADSEPVQVAEATRLTKAILVEEPAAPAKASPAPRYAGTSNVVRINQRGDQSPNTLTPQDLLRALLEGAGLRWETAESSDRLLEIMRNAGIALRQFAEGLADLLVTRADVKSTFKLDQTTVLPQIDNPLKVTQDTEQAVRFLLMGNDGSYLDPSESVADVCRDLKQHHDALLEGMTSAINEFVDRLAPEELAQNFDRTLNKKRMFNAMNQLKYWQLYCDLYPILTRSSAGDLPDYISEDFTRTYEKRIAAFKRMHASSQAAVSLDDTGIIRRPHFDDPEPASD